MESSPPDLIEETNNIITIPTSNCESCYDEEAATSPSVNIAGSREPHITKAAFSDDYSESQKNSHFGNRAKTAASHCLQTIATVSSLGAGPAPAATGAVCNVGLYSLTSWDVNGLKTGL